MRSSAFFAAGIAAVVSVAFTFIQAPSVRAGEGSVPFPVGYRSWTFLHSSLVPAGFPAFSKSPCVKPCTNGIFYFYANDLAMKGLRTGTYADGAIIAEEMLEFQVGEKGNGGEGKHVMTGVMVKDSKRYAETGGWGYGSFEDGDKANRLSAKEQEQCYQCHVSRKDKGYVFTSYTER